MFKKHGYFVTYNVRLELHYTTGLKKYEQTCVCRKEKIEHFAVIPFSSGNWQTENLNVEGI